MFKKMTAIMIVLILISISSLIKEEGMPYENATKIVNNISDSMNNGYIFSNSTMVPVYSGERMNISSITMAYIGTIARFYKDLLIITTKLSIDFSYKYDINGEKMIQWLMYFLAIIVFSIAAKPILIVIVFITQLMWEYMIKRNKHETKDKDYILG